MRFSALKSTGDIQKNAWTNSLPRDWSLFLLVGLCPHSEACGALNPQVLVGAVGVEHDSTI